MKDHPILFKAEMVRAILDGRKTQTRRVIKPQPQMAQMISDRTASLCYPEMLWRECPHGGPGDRLYVRETWGFCTDGGNDLHLRFAADNSCAEIPIGHRAWASAKAKRLGIGLAPSIHMPRWASRIRLEIASVRVERVRDISEKDAEAEGIDCTEPFKVPYRGQYMATPELRFSFLWDSINAKRGFGWDVNPWVWRIEFKRL